MDNANLFVHVNAYGTLASPNPSPNPNPNPNQVAAEDDVFDSAQVQPRIRRVAALGT